MPEHTAPDPRFSHGDAQLRGRYWPTPADLPRRPDGTIDYPAWCRQLDDIANQGAGQPRP